MNLNHPGRVTSTPPCYFIFVAQIFQEGLWDLKALSTFLCSGRLFVAAVFFMHMLMDGLSSLYDLKTFAIISFVGSADHKSGAYYLYIKHANPFSKEAPLGKIVT